MNLEKTVELFMRCNCSFSFTVTHEMIGQNKQNLLLQQHYSHSSHHIREATELEIHNYTCLVFLLWLICRKAHGHYCQTHEFILHLTLGHIDYHEGTLNKYIQ